MRFAAVLDALLEAFWNRLRSGSDALSMRFRCISNEFRGAQQVILQSKINKTNGPPRAGPGKLWEPARPAGRLCGTGWSPRARVSARWRLRGGYVECDFKAFSTRFQNVFKPFILLIRSVSDAFSMRVWCPSVPYVFVSAPKRQTPPCLSIREDR